MHAECVDMVLMVDSWLRDCEARGLPAKFNWDDSKAVDELVDALTLYQERITYERVFQKTMMVLLFNCSVGLFNSM